METIWKLLLISATFSIALFLQILSCFAFGDNWLPLIILAPMLLAPLPNIVLSMCSGSGDVFSEKPAGLHWAEFITAFFATGCFAVPILLAITDSIEVGACLTSLAGTLLLCGLWGLRVYFKNKDDSFSVGM